PREFSQSQTSVPSRSIARILYAPPGNTPTPAPLPAPFGSYTVSVGTDTFPTRATHLPATSGLAAVEVSPSGPVVVFGPGAPFGQSVNTACSAPAGQLVDCAQPTPQPTTNKKPATTSRITNPPNHAAIIAG